MEKDEYLWEEVSRMVDMLMSNPGFDLKEIARALEWNAKTIRKALKED